MVAEVVLAAQKSIAGWGRACEKVLAERCLAARGFSGWVHRLRRKGVR